MIRSVRDRQEGACNLARTMPEQIGTAAPIEATRSPIAIPQAAKSFSRLLHAVTLKVGVLASAGGSGSILPFADWASRLRALDCSLGVLRGPLPLFVGGVVFF